MSSKLDRIKQANRIHNNKFDYSAWPTNVYLSTVVTSTCSNNHTFTHTLRSHITQQHGCPICAGKRRTVSDWILLFSDKHDNKFDYSLVTNINKNTDVIKIKCEIHGIFEQTAKLHLRCGCPKCAGKYKSKLEWIDVAKEIHGNLYDYTLLPNILYDKLKVDIICSNHGVFNQRWNNHIRGKAKCPKCTSNYIPLNVLNKIKNKNWMINQHVTLQQPLTKIAKSLNIGDSTVGRYLHSHNISTKHFFQSTGELELTEFVKSVTNNVVTNVRDIIPPYELDVFIPEYNLAIEYCGLYWHSEQQGKDKHYHKRKQQLCYSKGIQLLTIFEDEWHKVNDQVKRKIIHLLGKQKNRIFARKCIICDITRTEKKEFLEKNHIQGNGRGSIQYGLSYNDNLIAVITFIKEKHGNYYLNRYATSCHVVGGFSKLLAYFKRNNDWNSIISFADLRWSDGKLYKENGWLLDKTIPPDYYYSPNGTDRFHKFNYRRKRLSQILPNFDITKSERLNCDDHNILRIWDCGKMRFIVYNKMYNR